VKRAERFIAELRRYETEGGMPRLQVVRLGGDHTEGTRVGAHTPTAMVAENDRALGLIIEALSHSKFWADTAVLVLEDDAQNGPDHVDAHRSAGFVIGPYVKQRAVVSRHYTTVSMLRTIEEVLGLPPMGLNDGLAEPMTEVFDLQQATWRYRAIVPEVLRRTDLPPDLAQLMFGWVSEALRSYILENFEIDPSTLRNALVPARDEAISEAMEMIDPAQRLVDKLHAAGDLRPTFLLKHLTRGDVILFEFTFAKLSDLSPVFIRRIIYESTGEGLALACAALGIDRSVFATMFRLTRRARREPEVLTPEKILRVKHIFETMDRSGAHSALRIWARERGYFTASTGQAPN
jgi:hypothetical protein